MSVQHLTIIALCSTGRPPFRNVSSPPPCKCCSDIYETASNLPWEHSHRKAPPGFAPIGVHATWQVECLTKWGKGDTQMMKVRVNGMDRNFDGDSSMPLLWYLRDVLGLREQSLAVVWPFAALARFIRTA